MDRFQINTCARITPIAKLNKEFALVKVYVHGIGKNRNLSYISKEVAQEALPTLNYVPVVGHIRKIYDEDGNIVDLYMGSHDWDIDWDNGEVVDLTVPYGVVIENSYGWETITEYGKEVEYLVAYAYLWVGRYPELLSAVYDEENVWFNQSMEINIVDNATRPLEEDSNYTEIMKMEYSALCLLGKSDDPEKHSEPCFINSKVLIENYSFNQEAFSQLMSEMKSSLARYDLNNFYQKGDSNMENETKETLVEQVLEAEVIEPEAEVEIVEDKNERVLSDEEYNALMQELDELRAFKQEAILKEKKALYEAVLAEFEDLKDNEEFMQVCENLLNFETEDALREKCYAIRGKIMTYAKVEQVNFCKQEGKIGIQNNAPSDSDEKYGDFFNKF